MLLRLTEETNWNQNSMSRRRCPAGDFQMEFRDQRYCGIAPIWIVRQLRLDGNGNKSLYVVFKKFLSLGVVYVALIHPPQHGLKTSKRRGQLAFQIAGVGQLQVSLVLDARNRTVRERSFDPASAVFVESQPLDSSFRPRQQSERRKFRSRIAIDVLAI